MKKAKITITVVASVDLNGANPNEVAEFYKNKVDNLISASGLAHKKADMDDWSVRSKVESGD